MSFERPWHLRSRAIDELVRAADQFEAWQTLRDRPLEDFGVIVTAEPDETGDRIGVHTATLMFWWGRDEDASAVIATAIEAGLPDTTVADRQAGQVLREGGGAGLLARALALGQSERAPGPGDGGSEVCGSGGER